MRYGVRSNGSQHGLVFTKPIIVETMLDKVGYVPTTDLRHKVIVEPSAGNGAFALAIISRLFESSKHFNFSFQDALSNLRFYEIDQEVAIQLTKRLQNKLTEYSASLPEYMVQNVDFLLAKVEKCDIVVGNPPYVRHENIPEESKKTYRSLFKTFTHRSDLYIAFYEKSLRILKKGGILSFICSNRWLKNQYGKSLRRLIGANYSLVEILDIEETNPFEESVIAYPAITTILESRAVKIGNYYRIKDIEDLGVEHMKRAPTKYVRPGESSDWFAGGINDDKLLLDSIENQGFKIGIGVATGADRIFISEDLPSIVEKELLLPILMSKDIRNNKLVWSEKYIINPFKSNGDLIDLDEFPKAKQYFLLHKEVLLNRHVAKVNPNRWYKTIDRINLDLLNLDKIILPDISGNSHLLIDRGKYYPHHNLYYITGKSYEQLVLLAAILMSDFVKNQLLELSNKMNGGYPRWQSQNLRKLRIPIISSIPKGVADEMLNAYHQKNYSVINTMMNAQQIYFNATSAEGQMRLFEPTVEYETVPKNTK